MEFSTYVLSIGFTSIREEVNNMRIDIAEIARGSDVEETIVGQL